MCICFAQLPVLQFLSAAEDSEIRSVTENGVSNRFYCSIKEENVGMFHAVIWPNTRYIHWPIISRLEIIYGIYSLFRLTWNPLQDHAAVTASELLGN
jgi:hypothetical protein